MNRKHTMKAISILWIGALAAIIAGCLNTEHSASITGERYPWKKNIVTTVFWIGEQPSGNNPVPNRVSSWDKDWSRRKLPRATVPRARGKTTSALQPFYYESRASKLESCA